MVVTLLPDGACLALERRWILTLMLVDSRRRDIQATMRYRRAPAVLETFHMIRPYRPDDLETLLGIWLEASSRAHDFVARSFWEARLDDMRNLYLPAAQTWVYERDGTLVGFVSLLDDILAAIFVAPAEQGAGIGSALLEHAKRLREQLSLTVYAANSASIAFYRRHGFRVAGEQLDAHTGHPERLMTWQRQASVGGGVASLSS